MNKLIAILSALTLSSAYATLETPMSSDALVDSIGINIGDTNEGVSPYNDIGLVTADIKDLGIRHIRAFPMQQTAEIRNFVAIATNSGAKLDFMMGRSGQGKWYIDLGKNVITTQTPLPLRKDYLNPYLSAIEFIEGPNEAECHNPFYSCTNGSTVQYPVGTITFQNGLSNTLRRAPDAYDNSPVITLPLIGPAGCCDNGNASNLSGSILDYENIHTYVDNGNTPDWGITGGIKWPGSYDFIGNADMISLVKKPVIITETGYNTGTGSLDRGIPLPVSRLAQAKYQPRIITTAALEGRIKKVYTWELFDGSATGNSNGSYGIIAQDANGQGTIKKLAYNAEKSLIALLSDPGASFTPAPLDYTITAPPQVEHLLLQKSNGDYYLILWQEIPVYGYFNAKGFDISNQPVNVSVTFKQIFGSAQAYTYHSAFDLIPSSLPTGYGFTVPVSDTLTILKFHAAGLSKGPPGTPVDVDIIP